VEQCERPELVTPRQIYVLPPSPDPGDHNVDRPERLIWVGPSRSVAREAMTGFGVRREKAALSSGCKAHPAISLQPEAIGAVMEVTKWLKPSNSGHDLVTA
jgi:hypothetical protein